MLDIVFEGHFEILLKINATETEVFPLVSQEASSLLNGISIANTDPSWHVGDRERIYR